MERELRVALQAGALAGLVGLAGFIVVHAAFVRFIPNLLLEGPIPAVVAGVAAGYGYHRLRGKLPEGLAGGAAYGALAWVPAAAAGGIAAVTGPRGLTALGIAETLGAVALALLLGAAVGWRLDGKRGAKALVAGAFLGTLLVGGTLLTLGVMGRPMLILGALLAIDVLAGVMLVAFIRPLSRRQAS